MTRRYADPVQVRPVDDGGPGQFLWRGRLYVVREVLAQWVEVGAWWRSAARTLEGRGGVLPAAAARGGDGGDGDGDDDGGDSGADRQGLPAPAERHVWRVEASSGRSTGTGVYDLACDAQGSDWHLARALD